MSQPPKPTEVIYLSRSTVFPALLAFGLAALVVGLFAWWPYSVIGGLIAVFSLIGWLRANRDEIARMPRHQRTDTAPIPLSVSPPDQN
jgi:fatty acid desaturase